MCLLGGLIFLAGVAAALLPFETKGAQLKAVVHYHERKLLSGIDVSEKAVKVSKATNSRRAPQIFRAAEDIEKGFCDGTKYPEILCADSHSSRQNEPEGKL
ncbi:UNVERIFIED_CONTAM: hypothetical protein NCL1_39706 [Trichonephila clavipes]